MKILFLFLDGVGLGDDDHASNPFASAHLPTLTTFTNGKRWLKGLPRVDSRHATFIPTDAQMGVGGKPQSATGQASIMTGTNIPKRIGYHYGPKPDETLRGILDEGTMLNKLVHCGRSVGFLNAYPPGFFKAVNRGKRLLSSNQMALKNAGAQFQEKDAFFNGRALSADFTGEGWHSMLDYPDAPLHTPQEAGRLMAKLAQAFDFTFFDHWVTDYVGHRGTLEQGIRRLEVIDGVVAGLLDGWEMSSGLIILTSDHGNIENIAARGHTTNPVPTLIVGDHRHEIADGLKSLADFAGPIVDLLCP